MSRIPGLLCLLCCVLFISSAYSQQLPVGVVETLHKVPIPPDALGVYVQQLDAPQNAPLISWQADMPMEPASTMKLVTSYAALSLLGPSYTWKTNVYMTGQLSGDILNGDLILQGGGDPHLVLENFWMLLRQVRAKGIREIRGNLVIDTSWLEPQHFDAADFDGDPSRPYNVGPDALLVNFNVLDLQLHPDLSGLRVETHTPVALHSIVDVRYVDGPCNEWRSKLTPVFSLIDAQITLNLVGTYPESCGDKSWLLQPYPLTPSDFDGALFRDLWRELGGQFKGAVQNGTVPQDAQLVTTYQSAPLADILRDMNKYSNNVMTRLVMLTIDREASQSPANPLRAAQLVQLWFAKIGLQGQGLLLENGSGLSRSARISPLQMGRMLQHAFSSPVMPELMASMPILGVDGTMQKRATGLPVAGFAHIKSGALEGVRNFAGYVLAASGKRYAVVCFVNHKNAHQADAAQDELLQWIYAHG